MTTVVGGAVAGGEVGGGELCTVVGVCPGPGAGLGFEPEPPVDPEPPEEPEPPDPPDAGKPDAGAPGDDDGHDAEPPLEVAAARGRWAGAGGGLVRQRRAIGAESRRGWPAIRRPYWST